MTDKERRESNANYWFNTYKEQVELGKSQINNLQERVQELEWMYRDCNKQVGSDSVKISVLEAKNEYYKEQNKRYREAIEKALKTLGEHVCKENSKDADAYLILEDLLEGLE